MEITRLLFLFSPIQLKCSASEGLLLQHVHNKVILRE